MAAWDFVLVGVVVVAGVVYRRRAAEGDHYRTADARPVVGNRELAVTFEQVARVDAGPLRADRGGDVRRLLEARLVGQRFLRAGVETVPFGLAAHQLLLAVPLVAWTAQARAADAGRGSVEPDDVREAVRAVDRSIGQIALSALPKRQRRAFEWVLTETDLVAAMTARLLAPRTA